MGTSLAAAAVAWIGVGGRGVRLLIAGVTAVGVGAMAVVGNMVTPEGDARRGTLLAVIGVLVAMVLSGHPRIASAGWGLVAAAGLIGAIPDISVGFVGDAVMSGCVTVGLCLGHWFLVDPHLPRAPMRALAWGALAGLGITAGATAVAGWAQATVPQLAPVVVAFGAISAAVLLGAVRAVSVPTYKGVQSATGLFYVCTMSGAGFIILASSLRVPG